jgi:hypothetical protein
MRSIGIGEIQRNSSIFSHLEETVQIVDRRRKKVLAVVYPVRHRGMVKRLAGKYRDRVSPTDLGFDEVREKAMERAMEEK